MAISRGLRRLLRVRNLEEEQSRQALESALGELNRLESALTKDEIFFELKDEVSPGVFKTLDSFICVIMPVRLS